jgi:hypothetical protein
MTLTVAGAPLFMSRLNSRSVYVRFVVHKVTLAQCLIPGLQFSPVSIIPPFLHIHSCTADGRLYSVSNCRRPYLTHISLKM